VARCGHLGESHQVPGLGQRHRVILGRAWTRASQFGVGNRAIRQVRVQHQRVSRRCSCCFPTLFTCGLS
jgi:hypothetical protein